MAQPTYEQLLDIINRKDQRIAELETQVRQLTAQLQEVLRANKRQAAPFSKGPPKDPPAPTIAYVTVCIFFTSHANGRLRPLTAR